MNKNHPERSKFQPNLSTGENFEKFEKTSPPLDLHNNREKLTVKKIR